MLSIYLSVTDALKDKCWSLRPNSCIHAICTKLKTKPGWRWDEVWVVGAAQTGSVREAHPSKVAVHSTSLSLSNTVYCSESLL
uniref:Uncharacterized protein n=1 Tax=Strix occidentalis caurina TaxID=311401 RepID=A0A8D0EI92_STROC